MTARRMRGALVAASVALPLFGASCGIFAYHSPVPHLARDPDLSAEVTEIKVAKRLAGAAIDEARGVSLELKVETRPGAALGEPSLAAVTQVPCSGGVPAQSDTVLGAPPPGEPARLTLAFSRPAVERAGLFAAAPAVLDLPVFPADRTEPRRCLRIPLQTLGGATEWGDIGWMAGLETRGVFFARPLPSYQGGAFLFALANGFWIRRWRAAATLDVGFVGERGVTGVTDGRPVVLLVGASLEADRLFYARGPLGLDLQLGYDILTTVAPNPESEPAETAAYHGATLHGPRVALRTLVLPALGRWPGFEAPPDLYTAALSVFVGGWWQGFSGLAPVFGLALDGNIGS